MSTTEKIRENLSYFLNYGVLPTERVIEAYGYRLGREGEGLVVWLPSKDYGFMAIEPSKVKVYGGSTFKGDVKSFALRIGRELHVVDQPLLPNDMIGRYIVNWKTQLPIKKFKEFYDEREAKDERLKSKMEAIGQEPRQETEDSRDAMIEGMWNRSMYNTPAVYANGDMETAYEEYRRIILERGGNIITPSIEQYNEVRMDRATMERLTTADAVFNTITDEMPF